VAKDAVPLVEPPRIPRTAVLSALELGKKKGALICGQGLTGRAAFKLFSDLGVQSFRLDERPGQGIFTPPFSKEVLLQFSEAAFVFVSPGVAPGGALTAPLWELGLRSLSEIDLLGEVLSDPLVAVTGTNGKSTTATLIHRMLLESGLSNELVGNIGTPFVDLVGAGDFPVKASARNFVAEVSSYQLEYCSEIRPKVAALLNLAENHLERHGSMERYLQEKLRITKFQTSCDFFVVSADDPLSARMVAETKAQLVPFGINARGENYSRIDGTRLELSLLGKSYTFDLKTTKLLGAHNLQNIAAATAASILAGATELGIIRAISSFNGLAHRLERVPNILERVILNDSKATTPHATYSDLLAVKAAFPAKKITLLLGGQAKQGSWDRVGQELYPQVERLIGFGGDGESIIASIKAVEPRLESCYFRTLREATSAALEAGDSLVLFAPGCASFDEFTGFEARGEAFKRYVAEIVG